jgi:hypothetical protein
LLLDLGFKIESNNVDDKGSKLVLRDRNTTTNFLPHEVVVMTKLLSHAQVVEKDLGPTMASLGKEIAKLERKAQALVNNIQDRVLRLEKERQKMELL